MKKYVVAEINVIYLKMEEILLASEDFNPDWFVDGRLEE